MLIRLKATQIPTVYLALKSEIEEETTQDVKTYVGLMDVDVIPRKDVEVYIE